MRDFLPEDVRRRQYVIGVIADVYQKYGFEPLETELPDYVPLFLEYLGALSLDGKGPVPRLTSNGRRSYTLSQINELR